MIDHCQLKLPVSAAIIHVHLPRYRFGGKCNLKKNNYPIKIYRFVNPLEIPNNAKDGRQWEVHICQNLACTLHAQEQVTFYLSLSFWQMPAGGKEHCFLSLLPCTPVWSIGPQPTQAMPFYLLPPPAAHPMSFPYYSSLILILFSMLSMSPFVSFTPVGSRKITFGLY